MHFRGADATAPRQLHCPVARQVFEDPALVEKIAGHLPYPRDFIAAASVTAAGRRASRALRKVRIEQADDASDFNAYEKQRSQRRAFSEKNGDWQPIRPFRIRHHAVDRPEQTPPGIEHALTPQKHAWLRADLARLGYAPEYAVRASALSGSAQDVTHFMRDVSDVSLGAARFEPAAEPEAAPMRRMIWSLAQLAQRDAITGKNIAAFMALREDMKIIADESPAARLHVLLHAIRGGDMFATEFLISTRKRLRESTVFPTVVVQLPVGHPHNGPVGQTYPYAVEHAAIASRSLAMARRIAQLPGVDFNRRAAGRRWSRPIDLAIAARDCTMLSFFADLSAAGVQIDHRCIVHHAVKANDASTLKAVLALPFADPRLPNPIEDGGILPIHYAAREGSAESLRILLGDPRIDIHARDQAWGYDLVGAIAVSQTAVRDKLALIRNVPLDWSGRDDNGKTALHVAASARNSAFVDEAFARIARALPGQALPVDPFAESFSGRTAFADACETSHMHRNDNEFFARMVLHHERLGPAAAQITQHAVAMVARSGNAQKLRFLLERGYDVNAHEPGRHEHALISALADDAHDVLDVLLARPELRTDVFEQYAQVAVPDFVLKAHADGYDPEAEIDEDDTAIGPLHVDAGYLDRTGTTFDAFVKSRHFRDEDGTFLHAMIKRYEKLDPADRDRFGQRFDAYLSRNDCNLSGLLPDGSTPLHAAARAGDCKLVQRLLLHRNIFPEARDAAGSTAAERAVQADDPAVLALLAAHPLTPLPWSSDVQPGNWLSYAAERNALRCIRSLTSAGRKVLRADFRADCRESNPLIVALQRRHFAAAAAICEGVPADVLADSLAGSGYLQHIISIGEKRAVELLLAWTESVPQEKLGALLRPAGDNPDILTAALQHHRFETAAAILQNARLVAELRRCAEPGQAVAAAFATQNRPIMRKIFASPLFDPAMLMPGDRCIADHLVQPPNRVALEELVATGKVDPTYICRDGLNVEEHLQNAAFGRTAHTDRDVRSAEQAMRAFRLPGITDIDAFTEFLPDVSDGESDKWIDSVLR